MKTRLLALLFAVGFASPTLAAAPAHPAMWVVKDADTTIYVFGTFHLLDGKTDWFEGPVRAAFDASKEVELEAILPEDPAAIQPLVTKYAVDPAGVTLSSRLTPAMAAKVGKELGALGYPAQAFEVFEPWYAAAAFTTLGAQKLGLTGANGPEAAIIKAAKAEGKTLGELEGVEFQLAMLDRLPAPEQLEFLGQTLDEMDKLPALFPPMLRAWGSGDTDALVRIMNDGIDPKSDLYRNLFTARNAAWTKWIEARLARPGTVFMAVGAGHLAGPDSVVAMLAKDGHAPEQVAP